MFWDNVAWVYDLFANFINRKANRALCEAVAQMIQPEDEALECACGTGLLSGVIATRCKSLIATDFSVNMLRRAERKYRNLPNIRFEPCDIMQLPYPDERFDVVIAANVIHLLDEPEKALQELSRVCRPGGRIILPTYMNRSESGKMGGTSRAVKTAGANFKREFTPETYRAFLTNAGYPNAQYTRTAKEPSPAKSPSSKSPQIRPSSKHRVGDDAHIVPAERTVFMEVSGAFDGAHWVDVGIAPLYNRKICAAL